MLPAGVTPYNNNIFIYLLYKNLLPPQQGRHAPATRKERRGKEQGEKTEEKRIKAKKAKPLTPTLAVDALIGDEEQMGKKKREQRQKEGAGFQPGYPRLFGRLLRPAGFKQ